MLLDNDVVGSQIICEVMSNIYFSVLFISILNQNQGEYSPLVQLYKCSAFISRGFNYFEFITDVHCLQITFWYIMCISMPHFSILGVIFYARRVRWCKCWYLRVLWQWNIIVKQFKLTSNLVSLVLNSSFTNFATGMILLRVFMVWTSMLFWNDQVTV